MQIAVPHEQGLQAAVSSVGPPPKGRWRRPAEVGTLPEQVSVEQVERAARLGETEWAIPIGIGEIELAPAALLLGQGDNALVAGPARCGKSSALALMAALIEGRRPNVSVTAVALRGAPVWRAVKVRQLVSSVDQLAAAIEVVAKDPAQHLLLIDDADMVDDGEGAIARLVNARLSNVRTVAAGRLDGLRAVPFGHFSGLIRRSRQGLALNPTESDGDLWQVMLPRKLSGRFPPGRGYLLCQGLMELVQVAHVSAHATSPPGPPAG